MSSNLFSVFAPQASMASLNWVSAICIVLWMPGSFWVLWSTSTMFWKSTTFMAHAALKPNLILMHTPGHTHWASAILFYIMLTNVSGLIPYVFTASSHLVFTLTYGLVFWLGYTLYSGVKDFTHTMAHLVPMGTPMPLLPLMVLIELVSSLIRPLTLSVRLAANMVAGHLLLVLGTSPHGWWCPQVMGFMVVGWGALLVLESAVACIQAYVFSMLSILYISDVNTPVVQI